MDDKEQEKISDYEKDLGEHALAEFKKKNYAGCLQIINKLENSRPNDFKVLHNKIVIEYYKTDLKKSETFQKSLTALCNHFKIKVDKLEEIDYCIAQFNQALLLYHQRHFTLAQRIIDRVYKFIEPIEENLAKQVSLLAIELQLSLRQPDKALTLINYLENNLMYGGSIPLKGLDKSGRDKKIQLPPPKPIPEEFQKKLSKYKVRCYLMNHSFNILAKEVPLLLKEKDNIDALFLSANLEYLKGNFKESLKILSLIPEDSLSYNESGESSKIMLSNNVGLLHHAMGKPNLACHYFQTALKDDTKLAQNLTKKDENGEHLYTSGGYKYHELMYNLGLALLYADRPAHAFDCFIVCVRRYHRNSRLWLRIAECCIAVHKGSNEVDFDIQKRQKELIVKVAGSKDKQKAILTTNLSKDKKYSSETQSYAVPVPSLEFASLCLRNAYLLIPSDKKTPPVPLFLMPGVLPPAPPPNPSLSPSNPSSILGIANLKNSILAASAYVSLCLGDYVMGLNYSNELSSQPQVSGIHRLLARLYAAECLVLLDKIPEALEHLRPDNVQDLSFDFQASDNKNEECQLKTNPPPTSAHATMEYNLAVAKTIRGQLDQAATLLTQIWQRKGPECQVPAHIVMLVIYIELKLGHAEIARNLLRQHSFQYRITS
ncbi:CCR4-NOT transcription complex subunit 10 isoform X2 [Cylas formicarius]|uniref:CCR4-NOT transcription complex subunit 10 isoform X2 n=1 Tax=Cylas formicarius TaxID=197179 RepID=UPI002958357A|nr:CCR4-NOT transcription complex subunit 10 isoform X2 [Cylas formicarius]